MFKNFFKKKEVIAEIPAEEESSFVRITDPSGLVLRVKKAHVPLEIHEGAKYGHDASGKFTAVSPAHHYIHQQPASAISLDLNGQSAQDILEKLTGHRYSEREIRTKFDRNAQGVLSLGTIERNAYLGSTFLSWLQQSHLFKKETLIELRDVMFEGVGKVADRHTPDTQAPAEIRADEAAELPAETVESVEPTAAAAPDETGNVLPLAPASQVSGKKQYDGSRKKQRGGAKKG